VNVLLDRRRSMKQRDLVLDAPGGAGLSASSDEVKGAWSGWQG